MPIENEFKFILQDDDGELRRSLVKRNDVVAERIYQGYLQKGVRIRRINDLSSGGVTFNMTFKQKVRKSVVEIETEIHPDDFEMLWPTVDVSLAKTRYKFGTSDGLHWDVDFFGKDGSPYFVMAEVERPAHQSKLHLVPDLCAQLADNLLYVVGKDKGFSSRRLCDKKYAGRLMSQVWRLAAENALEAGDAPSMRSFAA